MVLQDLRLVVTPCTCLADILKVEFCTRNALHLSDWCPQRVDTGRSVRTCGLRTLETATNELYSLSITGTVPCTRVLQLQGDHTRSIGLPHPKLCTHVLPAHQVHLTPSPQLTKRDLIGYAL